MAETTATLVDEASSTLSVDEVVEARQAASTTATASSPPEAGTIKLFHPRYESLTFGGGDVVIQFGPKGGFEPNVWIGPADHPLLPDLFDHHGGELINLAEPDRVFVCAEDGQEFKTKNAWSAHQRVHKGGVDRH